MTLRPLFAIMIALAMLFTPFAMQSGRAMAAVLADHLGQMTNKGHCETPPSDGKSHKSADKSCCAAMCTAVAIAEVPPAEPPIFSASVDRPVLEHLSHSFLAKLPTPPPRRA